MLKRKAVTKATLTVSVLLILLWVILGANASLAWFKGEDTLVNSLNFGDLQVNLYHKTAAGYAPVDSTTKVFEEAVRYEPGYTQVVYLKIENAGTTDFTYDLSVIPVLSTVVLGKNAQNGDIDITDYLKFGLVYDDTEAGLQEKVADRALASACATRKLSNYSENGGTLPAGSSHYCALILYMPTEVSNEANYRGNTPPSVEVGIGAVADQAD